MCNKRIKEKFLSLEYIVLYKKAASFVPFENDFLKGFSKIKNTHHKWAADPFVFEFKNKTYLFVELADRSTWHGSIAYLCLDDKRKRWKIIINEKWHLSFPNVFYFKNELIMMCESSRHNEIYFYVCEHFPEKWKRCKSPFLEGDYADSEIFNYDNKTYLITYAPRSEVPTLKIFKLEENEFKLAQTIMDTNLSLRPAGKVFESNNRLYIPTQNCKHSYGYGVILHEITITNGKLSFKRVKDLTVQRFNEFYKINANSFHTLNHTKNYIVIDCSRYCYSLYVIKNRIINKIRSFLKKPVKNYR